MTDQQCVDFLQWVLPRLRLRWPGFRKVRRQVRKRIDRRLSELGLGCVSDYRAYLESHPAEWPVLDGFCRISISRFYRDRGVFEHLGEAILPELARRAAERGEHEVRLWSAGCASGEEAYTLASLWRTCVLPRFPEVQLHQVATDTDQHMLDRAVRARYSPSSLKEVPPHWLDAAFVRDGNELVLRPEFAAGIEFRRQDIRSQMPDGPFHLVACRHLVFTYFDADLQRAVLERILQRLVPDGVLVTGKQESLPEGTEGLAPHGRRRGIYRICDAPPEGERWDPLICMDDGASVPADDPRCLHPSRLCRFREFCEVIAAVRKKKRGK